MLIGEPTALLFALPPEVILAGTLALLSGVGALVVLVFAGAAWWQRAWGIVGRLHYTLVAVAALYFVWYLSEVNLLVFRF